MFEVEMLKNLAGGGGLAFAMIVIFLRYLKDFQTSHEAAIKSLSDTFNAEHAATRTSFQEQVQLMTNQMYKVIDEYTQITRETVVAVKGLESAVRELQSRIK